MGKPYEQFCGLARALEVVGERWTGLAIRELALGPQRYSDLKAALPGIAPNLLAQRLRFLESEGLIRRIHLPPPAAPKAYELTAAGMGLWQALLPLAAWGWGRVERYDRQRHPRRSLGVALQHTFEPAAARGVDETYELRSEGQILSLAVHDGALALHEGKSEQPPAVSLRIRANDLLDAAFGRLDLFDAIRRGRCRVEGSRAALRRFARAFLPAVRLRT